MQKTWIQSLGQEYPLEEGLATHSSSLAWRIPWTEIKARSAWRATVHRASQSRTQMKQLSMHA